MVTRFCKFALLLTGLLGCLPSAATFSPPPPGGIRVLFIGNSLTYVNDLPATLSQLALTTGDTIRTASIAFPDYALVDHLNQGSAVSAIKADKWNFVVLQQGPSSVQINRDSLIMMTAIFDSFIKDNGAKTSLYSVWPQTINYSTFARAIESYRLAAESVHGVYLPVGAAWKNALEQDASLPLYSNDGLHPAPLGTYLAALIMYERFTGKDARLLPATVTVGGRAVNGVSVSTVRKLQEIAHAENVSAIASGSLKSRE